MNTKPKKLRFTLRTLFLLLTLCAVWLGYQTSVARRQRIAVEAIEAAGGYVRYDYQRDLASALGEPTMPGPNWLRKIIGDDHFRRAVEVDWNGKPSFSDDELSNLKNLPFLDTLNLNFSGIDDTGLKEVARLRHLKNLWLEKCIGVTDTGLADISQLANLEHLALLATNCTDAGVKSHISRLSKLQYLDVAGIAVTNETAETFGELPDLKFVHLGRVGHRARFDLSDAVSALKTKLPQCTVNYWGPKPSQGEGQTSPKQNLDEL